MINDVFSDAMNALNVSDERISPVARQLAFATFVEDLFGVNGVDVIPRLTRRLKGSRAECALLAVAATSAAAFGVFSRTLMRMQLTSPLIT